MLCPVFLGDSKLGREPSSLIACMIFVDPVEPLFRCSKGIRCKDMMGGVIVKIFCEEDVEVTVVLLEEVDGSFLGLARLSWDTGHKGL